MTEKLVRAADVRPKAWQIFDTDVLGLSICIYPSGSRSFMFDYRAAGRQRRLTIGRWPEWNVTAARERAKALRRDVDGGLDPLAEREEAREAPRFPDLVERYLREHAAHLAPLNAADQASMLKKLIEPHWKHRLVADIDATDIERVLNLIAQGRSRPAKKAPKTKRREPLKPPRPTPVRANRAGEMLRKVFNLAIQWKMRTDNPAVGFRRRVEVERERYLSMEEIARLSDALGAAEDQRGASIIRMCMLTGARLGEVRTARFEHFDLERGAWVKPAANTKQRRVHRVPISADTAALVGLLIWALISAINWDAVLRFIAPTAFETRPIEDILEGGRR